MVVHVCSQEAIAGGLGVRGELGVRDKFQGKLS